MNTTLPLSSSPMLAIETCTNICSVALFDGDSMYTNVTETAQSHSKTILPMIEALFEQTSITIDDIQSIACARGPGSFTGVRIGIGVAKGLAYGQDVPIIPVSPLQAVAYRMIGGIAPTEREHQRLLALLDARMGEVYGAYYTIADNIPVLEGAEMLTTADSLDVDGVVVGGTGVPEYRDMLAKGTTVFSPVEFPLAEDIMALARTNTIAAVSAIDFAPVYLRDKVTY